MCGILGVLPAVEENRFHLALNQLQHRGPDGYGVWTDTENRVTLGHRRLSILDLSSNGKQPMFFEDRYVITFNGEIYNFIEVREILTKKGYSFNSNSDTEVILASYHEWGVECLHKFNGMWAFAIWDTAKKELFLSRDRFGVKPLFFSLEGERLVFASEMKAIFPFLESIKLSKDFEWCKENIHSYESTQKCLIEGIQRFPAGHYGIFKLGDRKIHFTQYWETIDHLKEVPDTYEAQVDQFRSLLLDACRLRMRSDVRIGTALSGGVDSTAIICSMAHIAKESNERLAPDWQNAFVASFPNTELDESIFAKKVIDYLGVKGVFEEIDAEKGIDNLEEYLWLFEELYLTTPIPMIEVYKTIRKNGVVVSIDGHGGDELLSGYSHAVFKTVMDSPFSWNVIKQAIQTYKGIYVEESDFTFSKDLKHLIDGFGGRKNLSSFYTKAILGMNDSPDYKLGYFNTYLYEIFHRSILPTLLRNYDRYSMAAGVEVRMPFLDYRLVTYCFSLPWMSKFRNGYSKAILRDAVIPFTPSDVINRKPKTGFGTPFSQWMKGSWKTYILDNINSLEFKNSETIDSEIVGRRMEVLFKKPALTFDEGQQAWAALMPFFWEKAVVKKATQVQI